jgi:hypothetical protein
MMYGMIVQLPVTVAFGTDEEFDLRVRLEHNLSAALASRHVGGSVSGSIDTSHLCLQLESVADPSLALGVVKEVLVAAGLLGRARILLETRTEADPDDRDLKVLWSGNQAETTRVA